MRAGGERFLAAAERGDAVQHEHEVVEEALHVVVRRMAMARRAGRPHAGDDGRGDVDGRGEERVGGRLRLRVGGAHVSLWSWRECAPPNRSPLAGLYGKICDVRADRLVAILLMLQTRGQVTAGEVATELEISERTARRDLDSLGVAGLPVYSMQGRNGGWRLAGGGRTDLSGLTSAETQALFLLAGPRATTPELRAALRKLVRALPEPFRERAEAASAAVIHDATAGAVQRTPSGRRRCTSTRCRAR